MTSPSTPTAGRPGRRQGRGPGVRPTGLAPLLRGRRQAPAMQGEGDSGFRGLTS
jgi:hypothetical protein